VVATTREAVMSLLRQTLRPEFLNRVDEVIMFHPLMRNEIKGIIRIQLADLQEKLQKQGIELEFSDYAIKYFAEQGFDPQFGARPLKRLIQKEIVNLLSKKIISGELDKSRPVLIDVFDGVVVVRNEAEKANTAAE
jgi:ATP-dependent Clp protease ATP-binding subunit ClpB